MNPDDEVAKTIETILVKDQRYRADAYLFVLGALNFTMERMKRQGHLTGGELLEGIRLFGLEQYGRLTRTVFDYWGVRVTDDFGNIVFNLIDAKLLGKTETDSIDDFKNGYDFKQVFEDNYAY